MGKKRSGIQRKGMISDRKEAFSKNKDEESNLEKKNRIRGEKRVMDMWKLRRRLRTEKGGRSGCPEPARGQRTNDDDDDYFYDLSPALFMLDPPTFGGCDTKVGGTRSKIFLLASLANFGPPTFKSVAPPLLVKEVKSKNIPICTCSLCN